MGKSWNRGLTKDTHPSMRRIAEARRKNDNFLRWRERMKVIGKIKSEYPPLIRNGDLAELIGVVLGDGHIGTFPRSESLRITANSNNQGFVRRYARMIEKVFDKRPSVAKVRDSNAATITIYQKHISSRLGIPTGSRKAVKTSVPSWILREKKFVVRYLRGLYEAEGSYSIHEPTYTHKLSFSNKNQSLLNNVVRLLRVIGLSPHYDSLRVQISKKDHVARAIKLLKFREY